MENLTPKTNKGLKMVLTGLIKNNIFEYKLTQVENNKIVIEFNLVDVITILDDGCNSAYIYFETTKQSFFQSCAFNQKSVNSDIKEFC
jgi:hypothetical protein